MIKIMNRVEMKAQNQIQINQMKIYKIRMTKVGINQGKTIRMMLKMIMMINNNKKALIKRRVNLKNKRKKL